MHPGKWFKWFTRGRLAFDCWVHICPCLRGFSEWNGYFAAGRLNVGKAACGRTPEFMQIGLLRLLVREKQLPWMRLRIENKDLEKLGIGNA